MINHSFRQSPWSCYFLPIISFADDAPTISDLCNNPSSPWFCITCPYLPYRYNNPCDHYRSVDSVLPELPYINTEPHNND